MPAIGDTHFVHAAGTGWLRKHALGRFDDLLHAAVRHPAMLLYLDANLSTATTPTRTSAGAARAHTVGRGHYTEEDVRNSARILTGWSVERPRRLGAGVQGVDALARAGPVMGLRDANAAKDGPALRSLRHLIWRTTRDRAAVAGHEVRAGRPAPALVASWRGVPRQRHGDRPVLRALVASRAFAGAVGSRCATRARTWWRRTAPRREGMRPASEESAANALLSQASRIGTVPFGWPRPTDSRSTTTRGPTRHGCWRRCTHRALSGGWSPRERRASGPGGPGFRRSRSASTGWSTTSRPLLRRSPGC